MSLATSLASLSLPSQLALLALSALVLFSITRSIDTSYRARTKSPLPPGPHGRPLIGLLPNLLQAVKTGSQHLLFATWARQHGDLYRVHLGPFTQYMVNSDVAAKAIFEGKNAAVSANRPRWIVSNEYICHGWNVLLIDGKTARWKQQRKVTTSLVGSLLRADAGVPVLEYESLKFLREVAASQMFGQEIPDSGHEAIRYIHETGTAQIIGTLPGANLVDILPFLDNLPLVLRPWAREGSKRFARDVQWSVNRLHRIQNIPAVERSSTVEESLMAKLLASKDNLGLESREEGAYLCLMLTIGAADTSQISTWAFLEAMLAQPHVQRKAQSAIDEAVGPDRVPLWEDYAQIPYMRCLVKEHGAGALPSG